MNGKHYVGKKAQSFEQYEDVIVDGVLVQNSDGVQFKAGNEDGYVLSINCPYGTQQMADDLYAMLGGKVYRGYRAGNAVIDPQAELGDGITVNGIYSMLAYKHVNFGPNHPAEIAAPGESTLNHEYNYINPTRRDLDKGKGHLDDFVKQFTEYLDLIKKQTDQKAETWYQKEDPSTNWTEQQKSEHVGDIWYNTSDGNFYIYEDKQWKKSPATPPDYVFDRIDKKAEIYVTQPVPPYNVNDLWFGGTDEPIKVCVQSRTAGEDFHMEDWQKKDEYIDKSDAEQAGKDAVDAQTQEDIFNKLTNGGAAQGIFKDENGDIYVNAEYLRGRTIDLERLMLSGKLGGMKEGYGSTKDGRTTKGLLIWGPNGLDASGNAKPPYILLTNAGFRVQTAEDANFNVSNTTGEMQGNFTVRGNIVADGGLRLKGTPLTVGDQTAVAWDAANNLMTFGGGYRSYFAGKQAYLGGKYTGYETYVRGSTVNIQANYINEDVQPTVTSDREKKKDIEALEDAGRPAAAADSPQDGPGIDGEPGAGPSLAERYMAFMDALTPVRYRYKTEAGDAPLHIGYIWQDAEAALAAAGLARGDMAALGEVQDDTGAVARGIAYGELIPLLHLAIKRLERRIADLEEVITNG